MNRRRFFKKLVIGSAAIVAAPMIIAEVTKPIGWNYPSAKDIAWQRMVKYHAGVDTASVFGPELDQRMFRQIIILKSRRKGMTYMYQNLQVMNDHQRILAIQNLYRTGKI